MTRRRALFFSLLAVELAGYATVLRCLLFERWVTLPGALIMAVGAGLARRGHTAGIGVVLACATGFAIAPTVFIHAPGWFYGLAVLGVIPALLTYRPMAHADAPATALFNVGAVIAGIVGTFVLTVTMIMALTALGVSLR